MDDEKIVELFLSRDEAAIAAVSDKYGGRLQALALHITADRQASEECENETYFQAWNSIPPHMPKDYLFPFLARITRHIALNLCRNSKRLKRNAAVTELSAEMEQCIPASDDTEHRIDNIVIRDVFNGFLRALGEEKEMYSCAATGILIRWKKLPSASEYRRARLKRCSIECAFSFANVLKMRAYYERL